MTTSKPQDLSDIPERDEQEAKKRIKESIYYKDIVIFER